MENSDTPRISGKTRTETPLQRQRRLERERQQLEREQAERVHTAGEGDLGLGDGLTLRVRGAGASFVFRYTSPGGTRREMGLGTCARSTADQAARSLTVAREQVEQAREMLRRGVDPLDNREQQRDQARQVEEARKAEKQREKLTLGRCCRAYYERVVEPKRTERHAAGWIGSLEVHIGRTPLWHRPIDSITPVELLDLLANLQPDERARHHRNVAETARRIRQRLDRVYQDACFRGWCTSNPAAAIKAKMVEEGPDLIRSNLRALDWRAVPALMSKVRATPGVVARALEFAVLTCSRSSEALGARWCEIDLAGGVWSVPAERMKRREAHTVYLSPRAVEILRGQVGLNDVFVFPSPMVGKEDKPVSNTAVTSLLERLDAKSTTFHGLARSTFKTWASETNAAREDVVEASMAHAEADRVARAYNRAQFVEERVALMNAWADYLSRPPTLSVVSTSREEAVAAA